MRNKHNDFAMETRPQLHITVDESERKIIQLYIGGELVMGGGGAVLRRYVRSSVSSQCRFSI